MKLLLSLALPSMALASSASNASCSDDPRELFHNGKPMHCQWLVENDKCNDPTSHKGKTIGQLFCPVTCNLCDLSVEETVVETSSTCYEWGQEIAIDFTNVETHHDDWLGIFDAEADSTNLGSPLQWVWLTGDNKLKARVKYGRVSFGADDLFDGAASWPLHPGSYKVAMSRRNHGGPYSSYAETQAFEILPIGESCSVQQERMLDPVVAESPSNP